MAEPIPYDPSTEDSTQHQREQAWAELDRLVVLLHEHQVLRLACDSTSALAEIAQIVTAELDTDNGHQALENLYVLLRLLGRMPPRQLERVVTAVEQGLQQATQTSAGTDTHAPGLSGTIKLLRDEQLWQALGPALAGLAEMAAQLQERD